MAIFTALLVIGFAAELLAQAGALPGAGIDELVERHGLVPREWLAAVRGGAPATPARLLSPLSAVFLHTGPLHLAVNLAILWLVGPPVERAAGSPGLAGLLLGSGLLAAGVEIAAAPTGFAPVVGASGAVAGLVGAALALRCLGPAGRVAAGLVVVLELAALAAGGAGLSGAPGHAGGLLAGGLAGLLLRRRRART